MQKILPYIKLRSSLAFEQLFAQKNIQQRSKKLEHLRPIIVLGRGKSGTRLLPRCLENIGVAMSIKPQMTSGDVDDFVFRKIVKQLARKNLFVDHAQDVSNADFELFQKSALRLYQKIAKNSNSVNAWGWKYPETYLIAPLVFRCFPHARFIHIIRDGRDVAFRQHLTDDPSTPLGHDILQSLNALDQPQHIRAALSWKFQVEKYARFTQQIPQHNQLELRYEAFCANPLASFERIAEFLDIRMTNKSIDFVKSWIKPEHIKQHRGEDKDQVKEVEKLLQNTLEFFNYT